MPSGRDYGTPGIVGRIAYVVPPDLPFSFDPPVGGFTRHGYVATSSVPWLTILSSPTSSSSFPFRFTFKVSSWLGVGPRVAIITITDLVDGSGNGFCTVTQDGCATYTLDHYSEAVGYGGSTTDTFFVAMGQGVDNHRAPASWVSSSDVGWLTSLTPSGSYATDGPSSIFHFTVLPNTTTTPRVGHITIHGAFNCGPDPVFTVNQGAGPGGGGGGGPFDGTGYSNPFNLPEAWGYYLRAAIATTGIGGAGNAVCLRSNKVAPFGMFDDVGVITTTGSATDPRIAYLQDVRRLLAVYRHSGDMYLARSDDDGHSWGGNVVVITGAKHPTIATGIDGTVIIAAYIAPTGGATYGTIKVAVQGPGDTAFGTPFTLKDPAGANVLVADDSFHLCQPAVGHRLWIWVLMIGGDTGCSEWYSAEPGSATVTRVV